MMSTLLILSWKMYHILLINAALSLIEIGVENSI